MRFSCKSFRFLRVVTVLPIQNSVETTQRKRLVSRFDSFRIHGPKKIQNEWTSIQILESGFLNGSHFILHSYFWKEWRLNPNWNAQLIEFETKFGLDPWMRTESNLKGRNIWIFLPFNMVSNCIQHWMEIECEKKPILMEIFSVSFLSQFALNLHSGLNGRIMENSIQGMNGLLMEYCINYGFMWK